MPVSFSTTSSSSATRKRRSIRLLIAVLIVGAAALSLAALFRTPDDAAERSIKKAATGADRIIIDMAVLREPDRAMRSFPDPAMVEIHDPKAIKELMDAIVLEGGKAPPYGCSGDANLYLLRGEQRLLLLKYFHEERIAVMPPGIIRFLTPDSRIAVKGWFSKWGGQAMVDAQDYYIGHLGGEPRESTHPTTAPAKNTQLYERQK